MRSLTVKQKKLLKQEWERLYKLNNPNEFTYTHHYPTVDDIPGDVYRAIDSINPCEIFYQNVCRFFDDLSWEKINERNPTLYT